MFGLAIGTINWKNFVENLIITLIIGVVFGSAGLWGGYKIAVKTNEAALERLIPTIEKAIDKESISNVINNAIDLKIHKIKKSDSLNINIIQIPDNKQKPENIIVKKNDSVKPKKKKRKKFFGLFEKK